MGFMLSPEKRIIAPESYNEIMSPLTSNCFLHKIVPEFLLGSDEY